MENIFDEDIKILKETSRKINSMMAIIQNV
jgi:hypothetical protein